MPARKPCSNTTGEVRPGRRPKSPDPFRIPRHADEAMIRSRQPASSVNFQECQFTQCFTPNHAYARVPCPTNARAWVQCAIRGGDAGER